MHVDQPAFLSRAFAESFETKLFVDLVIEFHIFEAVFGLGAVVTSGGSGLVDVGTASTATTPSTPTSESPSASSSS